MQNQINGEINAETSWRLAKCHVCLQMFLNVFMKALCWNSNDDYFLSMTDGIKKKILKMALKKIFFLERLTNGTSQLNSYPDFQSISYPKISLFLLTTLQTVIFLVLETCLCNCYSYTLPTTTSAGREVPYGLELQHVGSTKSCWWVLPVCFCSSMDHMVVLQLKKRGGAATVGNYAGYLKQTEAKDDLSQALCFQGD